MRMKRVIAVASVLVLFVGVAVEMASAQGAGAKPAPGATPAPAAPAQTAAPRRSPGAGPTIVFETMKGSFEIETYPNEAPKTVEHVLALVKRNFYNGLRIHRFEPNFVVQWGDPQTRDMTKRDSWGTGGSGKSIGVSEVSPKRTHVTGAVAAAYAGLDVLEREPERVERLWSNVRRYQSGLAAWGFDLANTCTPVYVPLRYWFTGSVMLATETRASAVKLAISGAYPPLTSTQICRPL